MSDDARRRLGALVPPVPLSAVHELERALRRLHPRAELRLEVDAGAVVVTAELSPPQAEVPVPDCGGGPAQRILEAVSTAFELPVDEFVGRGRRRHVVPARQAAMHLCRELTDLSFPAIGRLFDGRDHTTVVHAVAASWHRAEISAEYAALLEQARTLSHARSSWLPGLEPATANDGRPQLRAVGDR